MERERERERERETLLRAGAGRHAGAPARGAVAGARARSAAATRVTDIGARRATAATAASMNVRAGKLMTDLTDCSNVHRTAWGIRHLVACFHGVPSDQPSSCSRRIALSSLFSRKTIT